MTMTVGTLLLKEDLMQQCLGRRGLEPKPTRLLPTVVYYRESRTVSSSVTFRSLDTGTLDLENFYRYTKFQGEIY